MVRPRRLELPRVLPHSDLNAARLPIPPRPHIEEARHTKLIAPCEVKSYVPALDFLLHFSHMTEMTPASLYSPEPVKWCLSPDLVPYDQAVEFMSEQVAQIIAGESFEYIWLLEHPPLYTAGTRAQPSDLIHPEKFDVFKTGRGGQYTYHGPGQRVIYIMLDLKKRGRDVGAFVRTLEQWIIQTLSAFNVKGETHCGRVGVWVKDKDGCETKIAAIGVRLKKWVSFHGVSINISPDLSHYEGIIPCGLPQYGVTSLNTLGSVATLSDVDQHLRSRFETLFGPTIDSPPPIII